MPLHPIVSAMALFILIVSLPLVTIIHFIVWLAIGLAIYFASSHMNSHLHTGVHAEHHLPRAAIAAGRVLNAY
ncbi:MAG TPA: hypothetical protein VLJ14_08560 [Ktedonobacterales bacterium]|jgi:hypothetical protein|nr:hypothetical protein [Ktedonobacterales bacterium]